MDMMHFGKVKILPAITVMTVKQGVLIQEGGTGIDQKQKTEDLLYVEKHGSIADVVPQKYEEEGQQYAVCETSTSFS